MSEILDWFWFSEGNYIIYKVRSTYRDFWMMLGSLHMNERGGPCRVGMVTYCG